MENRYAPEGQPAGTGQGTRTLILTVAEEDVANVLAAARMANADDDVAGFGLPGIIIHATGTGCYTGQTGGGLVGRVDKNCSDEDEPIDP